MAIAIRPYTDDWIPAVREFNRRLAAGGAAPVVPDDMRFPERPDELPGEAFLAVEDGAVRGGYILNHQNFCFRGEPRAIAHYRLPLSEGIIHKAYTSLGVQMLRTALKQQPLLYALGMGGLDQPLPKMLRAMGWNVRETPFYFRVNHPVAFLRNIQALRRTAGRMLALDAAAWSGIGWLGIQALNRVHGVQRDSSVRTATFDQFGEWADHLWERCRARYDMIAMRDGAALNAMYGGPRFVRLKTTRNGVVLGWAVLLDTAMRGDKHFGNMRVGAIVDALALPQDAAAVAGAAVDELKARGVDLIVSNQLHAVWANGLAAAGCRRGPSNFIFAASKKLSELAGDNAEIHINRGDGDGPIHL